MHIYSTQRYKIQVVKEADVHLQNADSRLQECQARKMSFIKRKIPGVKVSHTGLTKWPPVPREWHSTSRRQAATCAALHVAMKLRPPSYKQYDCSYKT